MIKMIKRTILVKAVTKELKGQLENKLLMINGNQKLNVKIMNDFINRYNLPIKLCKSIEELLSVLDLVINEVIKDKMGYEIVEFAKLNSFKNSYMLEDLRFDLDGVDLVVTDSKRTSDLCRLINPEIEIIPSSQIEDIQYYNLRPAVDITSIELAPSIRRCFQTIGFNSLRTKPSNINKRTKVNLVK